MKPTTALDELLDAVARCPNVYEYDESWLRAARRELAVLRELAESDDAVDEMKFAGSIIEAVERRAKARDAYRKWLEEQER